MTVTVLERWPEKPSLLARAQGGSDDAFAEVVEKHQAMVYSICLSALHDPSRAEDLAQEVFLQLYRSLARIESDAHLVNWLRRTATHRVIDACRADTGASVSLDVIREPESSFRMSDPFLSDRLRELVARLPIAQRMAVILRYGEEMTLAEIAEVLDIPVNTVKSNLRRGLARMREALDPEREER